MIFPDMKIRDNSCFSLILEYSIFSKNIQIAVGMKNHLLKTFCCILFYQFCFAQPAIEKQDVFDFPPAKPVRTLAEWEELEAIALTYDTRFEASKKKLIAEIAQYAKEEVKVLIFCSGTGSNLIDLIKFEFERTHGFENTDSLFFIKKDFDERVWIRDFGPHTVYEEDIGKRLFIDWLYDFNFQNADLISSQAAAFLDTDLHTTTTRPYTLKLDGGNFQSDGMGTAFVSEHIYDDNPDYNESQIDRISEEFMGVDNLIKFKKLPFDVIHHVDMHLKLLDEETLLIGQYPDSIADGPQIEENLTYLLENFKTSFGTDFTVHRIPMPADRTGNFPDEPGACSELDRGCYYTYTNALFINELIIVPTYFNGQGADISALNQWKALMPGYKIVGIDCSEIIKEYGAIHCVTKEIGVRHPLRITHQKIKSVCETDDTIFFSADIQHFSGIESSTILYSIDSGVTFRPIPMTNINGDRWEAEISNFPKGTQVTYFIRGIAKNGKTIDRPMPGEKGGWTFEVNCDISNIHIQKKEVFDVNIFPNPFGDFVKIEMKSSKAENSKLLIYNSLGEAVRSKNLSNYAEISTSDLPKGIYFFVVKNEQVSRGTKMVK